MPAESDSAESGSAEFATPAEAPQAGQTPPSSICILRLSALGDVTHGVALVNRLQKAWPDTQLTWIIGAFEHKLVHDMPSVEFITFNKKSGWRGLLQLHKQLRGRKFDALLHIQVSLRANIISTLVRSPLRIGYDTARSRDLHGLFVNRRIPAQSGQHVVDAFQSFADSLGAAPAELDWSVPIPESDLDWAREQLGGRPSFLISPCSSHALRNWNAEGYAGIANHVADKYGMQVVLCGGPSELERTMGDAILDKCTTRPVDLIGRDTIKRMLALLSQSAALVSPDSGPAHMATCTRTPVIGLHAASNPKRSGPYLSRQWCVDAYNEACQKFLNRTAEQVSWGTKVEKPGAMDLVSLEAVIDRIDALAHAHGWPGGENQ
ncbi:glycosyltransferase family 9 protein [Granulosicoccus antarcticus]|nr:glycosyltransferase family 9 protein [Granulosicoccus antarcticus]